ncbi:MAG: TetR/AcrR family transcriptional regulator [Clostridia bacterium]|nr:TetR/AcrR family transcriptional regulator [Clostridia bacterium]
MNKPNNRRRRESRRRLEAALVKLMQEHELSELRVTELCREAGVNRTTFYANYIDIFDLAESVQKTLEEEVLGLYREEIEQRHGDHDFLRLFRHIKENPLFYKTYFKLNTGRPFHFVFYDDELAARRFGGRHIEYHIEFFRNGLNAVLRKWLENDCRETPEEIFSVIREEYLAVTGD